MFLKWYGRFLIFLVVGATSFAQEEQRGITIDFLGSYYDQDGEHSPVTGGTGSEELQSASPVFVIRYLPDSDWRYEWTIGADNITSASTDAIDQGEVGDHVSSASRLDNRVFSVIGITRQLDNQSFGGSLGFSKEYDYRSLNGGLNWSREFNQKNTTLSAALTHYNDEVELYEIDGVLRGAEDRTTTDVSISLSQVFSPRTLGSFELFLSDQSGFLSSPFQEVILDDGTHVQERLPDQRSRLSGRVSFNHRFTKSIVQRAYYRYYSDDWQIDGHTLELETHYRLPTTVDAWLYPILRYHTQSESSHFGLPGAFSTTADYFTADRDLSGFDSRKLGLGLKWKTKRASLRRFDLRATYYDRDDGLSALNLSFGLGWSF